MSKDAFSVRRVERRDAAKLLFQYHYLKDISKSFKSGITYGCFEGDKWFGDLVGVIIFSGFPVPELAVGMLGLEREDQDGLFELSRLCMHPKIQGREHNITSWFVSRAIRALRNEVPVRVLLSYADNDFHSGTIYKACNFSYYGLSSPKKDFFKANGEKHSRGPVNGVDGEWRERSRKHRYVMMFDKSLVIKWEKENYPTPKSPAPSADEVGK